MPAGALTFDVHDLPVDAVTVEGLARLALIARRSGCSLRLLGASRELLDLIALMGLEDVLRPS